MNNNIQESYCSFEVSKLLKEKGCEVICSRYELNGEIHSTHFGNSTLFPNRVYIPTHSLAIEWIRVNFGIWITIGYLGDGYNCTVQNKEGYTKKAMGNFKTPQEATEAALLYTLQNLI